MEKVTYDNLPQVVISLIERFEKFESAQRSKDEEPEQDLIDVNQAAKIIGVSVGTLYNKIQQKEVPYMKLQNSKLVRFSKKDLNAWMRSGKLEVTRKGGRAL